MRNVLVRGAAASGLALLLLLSVCSASWPAEQVVTVKVTALSLDGMVTVTKPDGTTEALKDMSKAISLPATIEMTKGKGSFWISLPTALHGKYNTLSWAMRQGETVRVSLLESKKGARFEYLKGTQKLVVFVNNRENVLAVGAIAGTTSVEVLQNRINVPEKSAVLLTCPMNVASLVTMNPGQVSEVEFNYSAEDKYIQVVEIVSQAGSVEVTRAGRVLSAAAGAPAIVQPVAIAPTEERVAVPVPAPEVIEQSPYRP